MSFTERPFSFLEVKIEKRPQSVSFIQRFSFIHNIQLSEVLLYILLLASFHYKRASVVLQPYNVCLLHVYESFAYLGQLACVYMTIVPLAFASVKDTCL